MSALPAHLKASLSKLYLALWIALWPILGLAIFYPIKDRPLRLFIVVGIICLWSGVLFLFWSRKWLRWASLAAAIGLVAILVLPGHQPNAAQLRQEYVHSLASYKGTTYVWGGESKRGIDCSGLIRRGLIDAELKLGVVTANPALLRASCDLWWHDCSAKALKEQYRNQTTFLLATPALNRLDYARVLPGDIAVTANGVHTLAYIGDKTWIEADPGAWKVITVKVPSNNAWFATSVHIMRWRLFEQN